MPDVLIDTTTGEIIPKPPARASRPQFTRQGLNMTGAKKLEETPAGRNVDYFNLRDHPELNGQKIAMIGVVEKSGEFGPFVLIYCYLLDQADQAVKPVVIMTGSENVYGRALAAAALMTQETPVVATLKTTPSGAAWLLE